ncbi:MAG: 3-methyl-2-oxobutanoate dehydrogenase subunit VorB [Oscillospiraceae bacterium]|jgi:2-oxoglutarate ferredoxin oxidoreductase subunit alpha|nr:3-methyl-2-oxobutanoate dehydrogenase subunit VorB [Oscillospiraceae bacterium]
MGERFLMKGNEALAEAAILAGCRHFFGYPITPQTEVSAYMSKRMPKIGGTYLQAESEIAAINMVLGAAAAGARAMTSSSSPGISLKTEGISYMAGSDLPCVILNIQRGGPGLGGIQPSQADYFQATRAPGHGDLRVLVFAPATVQEMSDTVFTAFDTAERYRMPALILADGLLGQMMEPVELPSREITPAPKPWAVGANDGTRARNVVNSLYLQADVLQRKVLERFTRYAEAERNESRSEEYLSEDADVLVVAYGAASRIARGAVDLARAKGVKAGLFRPVTLWPFPKQQLIKASARVKNILVVEMSMGQMIEDVQLCMLEGFRQRAFGADIPQVRFFGRTGGVVPTPAEVLTEIERWSE